MLSCYRAGLKHSNEPAGLEMTVASVWLRDAVGQLPDVEAVSDGWMAGFRG